MGASPLRRLPRSGPVVSAIKQELAVVAGMPGPKVGLALKEAEATRSVERRMSADGR